MLSLSKHITTYKFKTLAPARLYRVGKQFINLELPHDSILRQRCMNLDLADESDKDRCSEI